MEVKALKEKISITVDSDLLVKIKKAAEKDERSLSQYINLVLRKHIEGKKETGDCYTYVGEGH